MSVYYQSAILEILPSGEETDLVRVPALQSSNVSFNVDRVNVNRLGRFAPMPYRPTTQFPTVNLQSEFIPTGSDVEEALGLLGSSSVLDNLLVPQGQYKTSTFRMRMRESVAVGQEENPATMLMESGVITNYSFQASVGQLPRTTFSIEGTDVTVNTGNFSLPTPDDNHPVLRPQDIDVPQLTGVFGVNEGFIQNFNISIPLPRTPIYTVGQKKPVARELQSPIIATVQMNAILSSFENTSASGEFNSDNMNKLSCGQFMQEDMDFIIYQPNCDAAQEKTVEILRFKVKKPYVDNVNYSNTVGGYTTVDVQFSVPISPVGDGFSYTSGESNIIIS